MQSTKAEYGVTPFVVVYDFPFSLLFSFCFHFCFFTSMFVCMLGVFIFFFSLHSKVFTALQLFTSFLFLFS